MKEEAQLKAQIKAHLDSIGAYRHMPVPSGYGQPTLDFLCCLKGRFIGIETKAPGKRPTPRQALCIKQINEAGGIAFWCDSYESYLMNMEYFGFIEGGINADAAE